MSNFKLTHSGEGLSMNIYNDHFSFVKEKKLYEFTKRIFDIILSILVFILALPIMAVTCLLVVLESKGNPIYSQKRVGIKGKEFIIYKIRSMSIDAEKHGAQWALQNDERVTKVGAFIRKTRIDELPQLINIIKGEMSLFGPRPERAIFYEEFKKTVPNFEKRLGVKPGVTGLAQVSGGYNLTPAEKLKYDLEYIEKRSFSLDFKILIKTIRVVITGDGAR